MIPFIGTSELWFLISQCIGIGSLLTSTIPLVPDYFMPSSFGLVNTWRAVFKNVGAIQANILISLNSSAGKDGFFT
jgi:hypothetical protein